jgi:hypothetical protein
MSSSRFRLLIVDDGPSIRKIASGVLTSEGYDVLTAQDGLDALDQLVEPLPDVIMNAPDVVLRAVSSRPPTLSTCSGDCDEWGERVADPEFLQMHFCRREAIRSTSYAPQSRN